MYTYKVYDKDQTVLHRNYVEKYEIFLIHSVYKTHVKQKNTT